MTQHHQHNHTFLYRAKKLAVFFFSGLGAAMCSVAIIIAIHSAMNPTIAPIDAAVMLRSPIPIGVTSTYYFHPEDGVSVKLIRNVGLTFYSRGDGYTPGKTMRSGRLVYEGAIAVSQPMWHKDVWPGDLIWVKATNRWYRVEDTMHEKYKEPRVDIYTHDMAIANSGSSKTDIVIVRQPK